MTRLPLILTLLAVSGLATKANLVDSFRTDPAATAARVDSIVAATPDCRLERLLEQADSLYFTAAGPEECEALYACFARAAITRLTDPTGLETLQWQLNDVCAVNAEGSPAADIRLRLASGHDVSLRNFLPGQPLLLFIYDPLCRHCLETIRELKDIDMTVLALCTEAPYETWVDTRASLPPRWIAAFDLEDLPQSERFVLRSMPQVYLLDGERNVVLKNPSLKHLLQSL